MSRVILFSRTFPSYHPKRLDDTYFVEKIWNTLYGNTGLIVNYKMICDLNPEVDATILWNFWISIELGSESAKHHTIRAGHRWEAGDWFSPRVWSGKPYNSKQIIIAPDIEVKNVWDFEIKKVYKELPLDNDTVISVNHSYYHVFEPTIKKLAANDGLELIDLLRWFQYPKPFAGQIISWSDQINY